MALTIKAYEDRRKPEDATLVVMSDKYTHVIAVKDYADAAQAKEKLDVETIVAAREKILDVNAAFIAAKVSGKDAPKEIDYSKLVTSVTTEPIKDGGKA